MELQHCSDTDLRTSKFQIEEEQGQEPVPPQCVSVHACVQGKVLIELIDSVVGSSSLPEVQHFLLVDEQEQLALLNQGLNCMEVEGLDLRKRLRCDSVRRATKSS